MSRCYYNNSIVSFQQEPEDQILGKIAAANSFDLTLDQRNSWVTQIRLLKEQLSSFEGHILFEFVIPRMGKRADVICLLEGTVFVLEFKVGSDKFDSLSREQVVDYALDLKNFHKGSHDKKIVPVLVCTDANGVTNEVQSAHDDVSNCLFSNGNDLEVVISLALKKMNTAIHIDPMEWMSSPYSPTPTIIEAAQSLYQEHSVKEISRSDAEAMNLSITSDYIHSLINESRVQRKKTICFVTGVPGAGKTLAGLNIATSQAITEKENHAVFLSGNGPLVDVLREALSRDESMRKNISKKEAEREVKAFIQNIHHFRDHYIENEDAPKEKVVIFDEAQRAWGKEQNSAFMKKKRGKDLDMSEPELLLKIMDRHDDWCCVICLIGGGQEINTGEAGLVEWLEAVKSKFETWEIHISEAITTNPEYNSFRELTPVLSTLNIKSSLNLHLKTSLRSFRAETLSKVIYAILNNHPTEARSLLKNIEARFPIVLTRDLPKAKAWLREQSRGSERYGVIASSESVRLRPHGINLTGDPINSICWYLNDKNDVRSSFFLEEVATEFETQGLEIDRACVCWDADLRYENGDWTFNRFRGTKWQRINDSVRQQYLKNAYRVLLTRARQGIVIFLPKGDSEDHTRPNVYYDETYKYLIDCGLLEI